MHRKNKTLKKKMESFSTEVMAKTVQGIFDNHKDPLN